MSRNRDISREEIAKQFLLPERQSKIDTLLKQDGQAYCICRSSDSSRFMIACDACEEWYHGDCMNISEKEAKMIRQYICIRCSDEDPTLKTRWKTSRRSTTTHTDSYTQKQRTSCSSTSYKRNKTGDTTSTKSKYRFCGNCMACSRTEDCGRCEVCTLNNRGRYNRDRICKQRICTNYSRGRRKRRDSDSDNELPPNAHLMTEYARHCYGPACTNSARYGSKYCSNECGLKLATNRILQVLPQRIQEWALSPCVSEGLNIKALDQIRKQQLEVRQILQELDVRHKELDAVVARANRTQIDPQQRVNDTEQNQETGDSEMSMYCITCGHEIHSRTAIKHMEKCFNKYESQATFGSIFKTRIEGNNMFCDYYNSSTRTYCKRLRVLCPEHSKDSKIGDNEVCGCPLVTNVFGFTGEFCRAPKKTCTKHHVWEKLRRAEIDLERVRHWLKLDELLEKERQIRTAMANRAGVLGLMLHSTYNHEVMEQITLSHSNNK